jgi:integrase
MLGKITLNSVAALRSGDVLEDVELTGFSVRCWDHTTSYSVRGRLRGQRIRVNIGRHGTFTPHTARREATRILGVLATGKDPRVASAKTVSFKEAADTFLAHVAARRTAGTVREYTGHLNDHLVPRFGRKPLAGVTTADLSKLHMDLGARPVLANRILSTTSSLYGWAETQALVPDLYNPARRVERYPEESKERFLSIQELSKLGEALRDLEKSGQWSPFALSAIRLLLFTGCRRNEIRLLQWPHVDWDRAVINLKKAKRGKRVVYLNAGALAVLRKLRSFPDDGNPYVIRGVKDKEPYKNLQDVWQIVRERAGLTDVRIHDLRHSVASVAGADGASLPLIGALLGHQSAPATKRYLHLTGDPTRGLADRVGIVISSALDADVDET